MDALFLSLVIPYIVTILVSFGYMVINYKKIEDKMDFFFEVMIISFCIAGLSFSTIALFTI